MGVHVLDVLVRPVEAIPEGQGGELVEEIRITAAGSAGGTALVLAKLGAEVRSAGAIGTDAVGDMLLAPARARRRRHLAARAPRRRADLRQRAADPPDGERPAFHVVGANGTYGPDDVPLGRDRRRHPPAPRRARSSWAARRPRRILARAREHGVVTSADVLAPGEPGLLEWIAPALPAARLPAAQRRAGARAHRRGRRSRTAAGRWSSAASAAWPRPAAPTASCSSTPRRRETVPAFEIEVVDTTGCGDAFSAGFLRGLSLGRERRDAAVLGCAAAALVAQGLGTDHGDFDLAAVEQLAA